MKYLFAVNPVSGKNRAIKKMNKLAEILKKNHFDFMIYETQPYKYAHDLRTIIEQNDITHVFAVGGDGTAHEVVNAVVGLDVYFGVIPFGSGNDFARMLKLPKKMKKVLNMIKKDHHQVIDVGQFGDRYFLNYISFGFDVAICQSSQKYKKISLGGSAYLFGFFDTLFKFKTRKMHINAFSEQAYLATIHNGKYYGGGMKINPLAELNDGVFDFCAIRAISKLKLLMLFPSVFIGKHFNFRKLVHYETNHHFDIQVNERVIAGVDGEFYYFNEPFEVKVVKQAVKMIIL